MMAPPGHRAAGVAVALSVVCKHSNTHAPAAQAIQPEACARVGTVMVGHLGGPVAASPGGPTA